MTLSREKILENREKWVNFLLDPSRKKTQGRLEAGNNYQHRCCIGHACSVLEIKRTSQRVGHANAVFYGDGMEDSIAPSELLELVGLIDVEGSFNKPFNQRDEEGNFKARIYSLVQMNDETDMTPQEIGQFIKDNITGEEETSPFYPLSTYPTST